MIIGIAGSAGSGKDTLGKLIVEESRVEIHGYHHPVEDPESVVDDGVVGYKYAYQIRKFAYKLKEIAAMLLGVDAWKFEEQDYKMSTLGPEWDYIVEHPTNENNQTLRVRQMTVREFLAKLGTDAVRNGLHDATWVNALMADYKPYTRILTTEELWYLRRLPTPESKEAYIRVYPNWVITDVRFPNEYDAIKKVGGIVVHIDRPNSPFPKGSHTSETALEGYPFDYSVVNWTVDGLKEDAIHILKLANDIEGTFKTVL